MKKKIVLGAILLSLVVVSSQTFATGELSVNHMMNETKVGQAVKAQANNASAALAREVQRDVERNQQRREQSPELPTNTALWMLIAAAVGFALNTVRIRV